MIVCPMHQDDPNHLQQKLALLAMVLSVIMFVLPLAFDMPLLDPDEGLHASIAQEMVERNDWVMPQLMGQPFLDKPILYFWCQALSLKIFGSNELAIRLPGLMFGLLGAITTGLLGWKLFDRETGWISGILYATTILPTAMTQIASHDVALTPWINLALLLLWQSDRVTGLRAAKCILLSGAVLGLAILTKGLLGIAVVGMAYGGYLLYTRNLRFVHLFRAIGLLLVAALVASPWYYLIETRNPGYFRYYFLERHLLGFATTSQRHGDAPWWYYFPIILGGGLPWIGYLPAVVQECIAKRGVNFHTVSRNAMPLLWIWFIGWTLLMTMAGSKLATYIWPIFPALAILVATLWRRRMDDSLSDAAARSIDRTFRSSSWSGPIVMPAAMIVAQKMFHLHFDGTVWCVVIAAAIVAPLPILPWRAKQYAASLTAASLSLAAQFILVMAFVLPPVGNTLTAHDLAEHFNRQNQVPDKVYIAGERIGSLIFYLTPELRASLQPDQIVSYVIHEPVALQPGNVLVVPRRVQQKLTEELGLDGIAYKNAGRYRIYTIPNPTE